MSIEELAQAVLDADTELSEFAETEHATFVAFASAYRSDDELMVCKGCHGG